MARKLRAGRFLFIAILIIAVAVFAFIKYSEKFSDNDNALAATVNGYKITKGYVETRYALLPDTLKATVTYDDFLGQTIDSFLIFQEAEKQGYSLDDKELDERMQKLRDNTGLSEAEFEAQLLEEGITLEDFRQDARRSIIVSDFINSKIASAVEVSGQELNDSVSQFDLTGLNISEAEVRLQLEQQLRAQKTQLAIQTLLSQLRAKAVIVK